MATYHERTAIPPKRVPLRKRPYMPAGTLIHGRKYQHSDCVYADWAMRLVTICTNMDNTQRRYVQSHQAKKDAAIK